MCGGRRLLFLFVIVAVCGCGGSGNKGPKLYSITGDVKFNGEPLESGRILFRSKERDQKGFSGDITNGKYRMKTEEGKMSVEITASRLIAGKFSNVNGKPEPVGEMYVPANYNTKTTLEAVVDPKGKNNFPFELEGKSEAKK